MGRGWGGEGGRTARTRGLRRALRAHGGAASPPMCRQRSRGSCAAHAWRGEGARSGPFSGAPRAPIRCAAPMPRLGPVPLPTRTPCLLPVAAPCPVPRRSESRSRGAGRPGDGAGAGNGDASPARMVTERVFRLMALGNGVQRGAQPGATAPSGVGTPVVAPCRARVGCGKKSYGGAGAGEPGSHRVTSHSHSGHPMSWARLIWGTWHYARLS